jgi:hypothetical protein
MSLFEQTYYGDGDVLDDWIYGGPCPFCREPAQLDISVASGGFVAKSGISTNVPYKCLNCTEHCCDETFYAPYNNDDCCSVDEICLKQVKNVCDNVLRIMLDKPLFILRPRKQS